MIISLLALVLLVGLLGAMLVLKRYIDRLASDKRSFRKLYIALYIGALSITFLLSILGLKKLITIDLVVFKSLSKGFFSYNPVGTNLTWLASFVTLLGLFIQGVLYSVIANRLEHRVHVKSRLVIGAKWILQACYIIEVILACYFVYVLLQHH